MTWYRVCASSDGASPNRRSGGSQEGPLDPARGRGQVVDDDGRDGVEDIQGAGLFRGQPLEALSCPLQRVTVLLADGDDECLTNEHHDPTDLELRRRVL
ncbi:hypothetical protein BH23ACT10_BH23ACT10_08150 [soil metagenome]